MIKKLQAMKKNKKGFTLVELIVVLVILAILAALLMPTLTAYIDKANGMKAESACRMAVMGTKAEVGDLYGKMVAGNDLSVLDVSKTADKAALDNAAAGAVKLSELAGGTCVVDAVVNKDGEVTEVTYRNATFTCVYKSTGGFTVTKETNASTLLTKKFTIYIGDSTSSTQKGVATI